MKPYPFLCGEERIVLPTNPIEKALAQGVDQYLREKYPDKCLGIALGNRYLFQETKLELNWFDDFLIHEILEVEDCFQALYKRVLDKHLSKYGGIDTHPIINSIAMDLFPNNDIPGYRFMKNYIADSLILQPPYHTYLQETFQVRILIKGDSLRMHLTSDPLASKNLPNIVEGDWVTLNFDHEHCHPIPEETYELPDGWYFAYCKLPLWKILELNMAMLVSESPVHQNQLGIPASSVFQDKDSALFFSRKDLSFSVLDRKTDDPVIKSILVSSLGKN